MNTSATDRAAATITESALRAALAGSWEQLRRVPKSDLHAHYILSAPYAAYGPILGRTMPLLPARFEGLHHFLQFVWNEMIVPFRTAEQYEAILQAMLEHMVADGVVYSEVSFDLLLAPHIAARWSELAARFEAIIDQYSGRIRVWRELGVRRENLSSKLDSLMEEALATEFFEGIDVYGDELAEPIERAVPFIMCARERGLKIKIHSGEIGESKRVRREVALVKPDGVQHGIRAAGDHETLAVLRDVPTVNVCPQSNYLLRCVESYDRHPIRELFDAGVRVTINSDDYGVFGRSVSEEYAHLFEAGLFSASELERIRLNGLAAQGR